MLRLIGFLVVVAVAVGGVGMYRGWFSIETAEGGDGKSVTLRLDDEKAKADLEKAKEAGAGIVDKGAGIVDKVEGALGGTKLEGSVKKVNADKRRLRVQPADGGDVVAVTVPTDDLVRRDGAASALSALEDGDAVTVTYVEKDGEKVATKVEATSS